jgi:nucleoside-diphosphate-sugar epimerase
MAAANLGLKPSQYKIIKGDITLKQLGLSDIEYRELGETVTAIFHLAALYDLTAGYDICEKVNVLGTRSVLAFADACLRLEKFSLVSTCYVAGARAGVIREVSEPVSPQFNNYYEATKYLSERLVSEWARLKRRTGGAEATKVCIFRPSIVIGDSQTGATTKFDGPMVLVKFLLRWRWLLRFTGMPSLGLPKSTVNVVAVDVVARAILAGGCDNESEGVYQLAIEKAPSTEVFFNRLVEMCLGRPTYPCPVALRLRILRILQWNICVWITGIPRQTIDYFFYQGHFDTTRFASLNAHLGWPQPSGEDLLNSWLPRAVNFARNHSRGTAALPQLALESAKLISEPKS